MLTFKLKEVTMLVRLALLVMIPACSIEAPSVVAPDVAGTCAISISAGEQSVEQGQSIDWHALASCSTGTPEISFTLAAPGSANVVTSWSTAAEYDAGTSGLPLGNYHANAKVRAQGTTSPVWGAANIFVSVLAAPSGAPASRLAFWGDSLTAGKGSTSGHAVPAHVSSLLGGRTYYQGGIGGQTSDEIAARAAAVPTIGTVLGGMIPAAATAVEVDDVSPALLDGAGTLQLTVRIAGVLGKLVHVNGPPAQPYQFTRLWPGAATSSDSDAVVGVVFTDPLDEYVSVIWAGRNDTGGSNDTESAIGSIVAGATGHCLVLSVLTGAGEGIGTTTYDRITALNASLGATYGSAYLDVRELLSAGTSDDTVPASLRSDTIHLNDAGYDLVSNAVAGAIAANGW